MKLWTIAIVATVFGILAGLGSVWLEFATVDAQFEPHNQATGSTAERETAPRAVIPEIEFDFGTGQRNSRMRHTFMIYNEGNDLLELQAGSTTCKCTLSNLDKAVVEPGGSTEVMLDWKLSTTGSSFRQSAQVTTNDVSKQLIELVIHGKIIDRVRLDPAQIVLTSLTANEEAREQFYLYGYEDEPIEITSWELGNAETASFYDLTFEPLDDNALAVEENAKCGFVFDLVVKPGLPLGPINQTIRLTTNIEEIGTLEVGIVGSIVSDISIVGGRAYAQDFSVLKMGTCDAGVPREEKLRILIKGSQREDTEFEITQIDPADALEATLSEPKSINDGAVYMRTLTIRVPENARRVNRLGAGSSEYGKIVIETTHSDVTTIPIYVKFAVR
jgi:hypothetical protein